MNQVHAIGTCLGTLGGEGEASAPNALLVLPSKLSLEPSPFTRPAPLSPQSSHGESSAGRVKGLSSRLLISNFAVTKPVFKQNNVLVPCMPMTS